ncbi:hypothetical protein B484DRAFT_392240 [Ochromonadaceae sp. CCMP2298]|nr:hypothetical protein B484DRAFT_392240 [Ochromonadaceae sp. CCMP2298]
MARVESVMKRQELLKNLLSYPVHSLFGGKTALVGSFFPQQRMVLLWISLGLNVYYAYMTSLGERFKVNDQSRLNSWNHWGTDNAVAIGIQENLLLIVKCAHTALNASLSLSVLLNSNAAHELYSSVQHSTYSSLLLLLVSPLAGCYVVMDALWPLLMLLLSLVALLFDRFWLYVPCLFDVVFQLTFMNFLYKAVALNSVKICYVMMLAFLCLYFYAVIATLYFPDQYTFNGHGGCSNLIACFKLHMDYGLYEVPDWGSDGYISPELPLPFVYGQLIANAIGTLFNVSYVILINLVLSSIVSGLIIDTFSSLREANEHTMEDIRTNCFVCSISRDEFEQADVSFDTHTKYEHNMWHYLFFQIHIQSKDPATLSRSEHHASLHFSDQKCYTIPRS